MPFRPDEITRDHVLRAVARIVRDGIHLNPSRRYDVIINGTSFPPKEVMRYAHAELPDGELRWDLSGGEPTNSRLRALEFEVRVRQDAANPLQDLIQRYKKILRRTRLEGELYKWRIVKKLKGRPNPKATDFTAEMAALKYKNLIYPMAGAASRHLCRERVEPYRNAIADLLDQSRPLAERVTRFISSVNSSIRN